MGGFLSLGSLGGLAVAVAVDTCVIGLGLTVEFLSTRGFWIPPCFMRRPKMYFELKILKQEACVQFIRFSLTNLPFAVLSQVLLGTGALAWSIGLYVVVVSLVSFSDSELDEEEEEEDEEESEVSESVLLSGFGGACGLGEA